MRYNIKKRYSPSSSHIHGYGGSNFLQTGGVSFGRSSKSHHGHSNISHHDSTTGGHHRSSSPHCALEYQEEISHTFMASGHAAQYSHNSQSYRTHSENYGSWKSNGLLNINEKETMQYLNQRLASYLEKVRSLEKENGQLEEKISEWYEKNSTNTLPDSSQNLKTVEELQNKISAATAENAKIALQIDNSKWAADDFRNKFDIELKLRSNSEADVQGLRQLLEGLNKENRDLEMQVQELQEELNQMKKNHDEEVTALQSQLGARINVEVDAAPSEDLNRVLTDIRGEYESLMERNLKDVEAMFLTRTEELSRQVQSSSENLQSVQIEIIGLNRSVQNLEIELQSQLNMQAALEENLSETERNYGSELAQLQRMIDNVESELVQFRYDLERQNTAYRSLMDQKNLLEMEIATYKSLLDGQDNHIKEECPSTSSDPGVPDVQPTVSHPETEPPSETSS